MKRFSIKALALSALALLSSCGNTMNDGFEGSEVFVADFEQRQSVVEKAKYFEVFERELTKQQREALQFLYAYMALPDMTDYSGDYYLECVDYALRARAEMPWGERVPDREFLHFVLPPRVNNENLDGCRAIFYNELKPRIEGLSMKDAVLEVNHWCHEKVTYTPSDSRTSSPLASIKTAYGRCGEESTFTVAALRAVGIPARQVYTPRWAHTDSNHAWVEAWIDGEWHFLGACEPEPVLDLAWFNAPASRGMLMHTKAFGRYGGPEEVVSQTPCFTEINVTENYAPTAPVVVKVVDDKGNPVSTEVEFKIYN
jgi:transglutaminase-like putative cysteine protease